MFLHIGKQNHGGEGGREGRTTKKKGKFMTQRCWKKPFEPNVYEEIEYKKDPYRGLRPIYLEIANSEDGVSVNQSSETEFSKPLKLKIYDFDVTGQSKTPEDRKDREIGLEKV